MFAQPRPTRRLAFATAFAIAAATLAIPGSQAGVITEACTATGGSLGLQTSMPGALSEATACGPAPCGSGGDVAALGGSVLGEEACLAADRCATGPGLVLDAHIADQDAPESGLDWGGQFGCGRECDDTGAVPCLREVPVPAVDVVPCPPGSTLGPGVRVRTPVETITVCP